MDYSLSGSSVLEDSPGKNTRVGCHSLLQGIFPSQGSNPGLLHLWRWQAGSLPLIQLGGPIMSAPIADLYWALIMCREPSCLRAVRLTYCSQPFWTQSCHCTQFREEETRVRSTVSDAPKGNKNHGILSSHHPLSLYSVPGRQLCRFPALSPQTLPHPTERACFCLYRYVISEWLCWKPRDPGCIFSWPFPITCRLFSIMVGFPQFSSVTQSCPTLPSPTPSAYSNTYPSSWWCHPTISPSVILFSSCLQSFPASGSFQMSQFFPSGGQSIGVSASTSVLPMNIQDWFPLGWTGWISLQFNRFSRVFSNTTDQKHQFFGAPLSLESNSHIHTWLLGKP